MAFLLSGLGGCVARAQQPAETKGKKNALPIGLITTKTAGIRLKLIPAGEFQMGSPDGDDQAFGEEKPRHRVRITQPFYLGVTEVTRGQFRVFVDDAG
jgi:formylglycine-generating enzyme required for sulfatase activity